MIKKFKKIKGWITPCVGCTLSTIAAVGPGNGSIVEIGSYMGKSTCYLAYGSKSAGRERVFAVDHFKGSPEHKDCTVLKKEGTTLNTFKNNLESANLLGFVNIICKESSIAAKEWSGDIRLLFIDGCHSYESVKRDFEMWSDFIIQSGLVAFHDYENPNYPDVKKFCDEITGWKVVLKVGTLKVFQK